MEVALTHPYARPGTLTLSMIIEGAGLDELEAPASRPPGSRGDRSSRR